MIKYDKTLTVKYICRFFEKISQKELNVQDIKTLDMLLQNFMTDIEL